MKVSSTKRDIRNKDHTMLIPAGARVIVEATHDHRYANVKEYGAEKGFRIPYIALFKYVHGFTHPPSHRTMERHLTDGVTTTPTGARTEPDGGDRDGFPSWFMVMEIIG